MAARVRKISGNAARHVHSADLRAVTALAVEATHSVTGIAESVHQAVWRTLGAPSGKTKTEARGITGFVYRRIHQVTNLVGKSIDVALGKLQPLFEITEAAPPGSPLREAVLAALNGVMGDRLAASNNAFATPMTMRHLGKALDWQAMPHAPHMKRKVLLLIHGLCMNDLQWATNHEGSIIDHGATLAAALDATPIYLRYNTGLPIAENGRTLSAQLSQLAAHWPVPMYEITIVAHSMGGLVARSACDVAGREQANWFPKLKSIVFLGTPHHGAPLERAGHWVDMLLAGTPYSAPFLKLTQLRSAGIVDLRDGNVSEAKPNRTVPLPEGVHCYTIAATTASRRSLVADRLIGDGLVPLNSALGLHDDKQRCLSFAKTSRMIAYRTNHMALLTSAEVAAQMIVWLTPAKTNKQHST